MNNIINVNSKQRNYKIIIDRKIRFNINNLLKPFHFSKVAIITDDQVSKLYLEDIIQTLKDEIPFVTYEVKHGENSKSLKSFEQIHSFLLNHHFDRHSAIIALGGGVIGDLAGFVASTYMRGIGFIQVPTTLLAHDSSIGGKVAINFSNIKNVIGAFYSPHLVVYDLDMLKTLEDREIRSGFAEMVKHGWIKDEQFLNQLKNEMELNININTNRFNDLLKRSIEIKQEVIEKDEYENDERKYLNFGHTLGHAIEAFFKDKITHGESIMYGMLFALYVSDQMNQNTTLFSLDIVNWIKKLNYPFDLINNDDDINKIINKMRLDKKNLNEKINLVLLKEIGSPYLKSFNITDIRLLLNSFQKQLRNML